MIFGNIKNLKEYPFLEGQIKKCFAFVAEHDLVGFEKGKYKMEGEDLFVNVTEYTTAQEEECFWEAHKKYIDLHLMLCGQEQIDINFIQNMQVLEYMDESDFLQLDGGKNCSVVLNPGDFLICYPSDGHRTAVAVEKPESIKQAIFKIKIDLMLSKNL